MHTALREGAEETGLIPGGYSHWPRWNGCSFPVGFPRRSGAGVFARSRAGHGRRRIRDCRRRAGSAESLHQSAEPPDGVPNRGGQRYAGQFLSMRCWWLTGHVISAMLDVAGWAQPWDTEDIRELDEAMALVGDDSEDGRDRFNGWTSPLSAGADSGDLRVALGALGSPCRSSECCSAPSPG